MLSKAWLPHIKAESRCSMKILRADVSGEFILAKLQFFYKKRGIVIQYTAPYIYEENRLAKQR